MSFWSVCCLSQKLSRNAYILAHSSARQLPASAAAKRMTHHSSVQMVKKRALEARLKLHVNKYPTTCITSFCVNDDGCETTTTSALGCIPSSKSEPLFRVGHVDNDSLCSPSNAFQSTQCRAISQSIKNERPSGGGGWEANSKKQQFKYIGIAAGVIASGSLLWMLTRDSKTAADGKEKGVGTLKKTPPTLPASSAEIPKHVPYLIIGGGTAAFSAFRAIKSNDARAKVLIISNENRKPYMRPPLSKELWYSGASTTSDYRFKQWTGSERSLYFEPEEFFVDPTKLQNSPNGGVAVAQGFTVKKVDAQNRIVTLNDGYEISYDDCLIATGCSPRNVDIFQDASPGVREKVMVYRTPEDFDRLRKLASEKRTITIVGNGFIGSELACSLAHYTKQSGGAKVYQVFEEKANMSKVLPNYLSHWTMNKMKALGVSVIPDTSIKSATRDESKLKLELDSGVTIMSDIVVVCVGCTPNTALAQASSLEVDGTLGGFVVNAELEARRNLYVAGDASCFYDPLLGRRRVEHHDHSVVSGRLAGENMTGAKKPYKHQSMFWSDLGPEIGYEGIGLVDSSLQTVGVFALAPEAKTTDTESKNDTSDSDNQDNYGKGVIFYLKNDKIVGILLWNLFNRIGLARTIINQDKKYDDFNEVAKLFEIHAS